MVSNAWKSFLLFGIAVNSLIYPPFLQSHDSVGPSAGTKNQWSIFFQIGNAGRELENKINGPFVFRLVMHDETLNIKTTFPDKSNRPKTGLRNGPPPDETLNIKSTFPDKTNGPKTGLRKGPTNDETSNIKSTFSDKSNRPKTGAQNGPPHDETLNIKSTFPDKSNRPKTGLRNGPPHELLCYRSWKNQKGHLCFLGHVGTNVRFALFGNRKTHLLFALKSNEMLIESYVAAI